MKNFYFYAEGLLLFQDDAKSQESYPIKIERYEDGHCESTISGEIDQSRTEPRRLFYLLIASEAENKGVDFAHLQLIQRVALPNFLDLSNTDDGIILLKKLLLKQRV
jgi:hypothetical protein